MNINWKLVGIGAVGTIVGFLLESPSPVGQAIWPMAEGMPDPEGANLALLMVMGGIEALAFGLGVVFLVAGYPVVRNAMAGSKGWSVLSYLSVAWLLMNWVPHTSLHMANGNITTPGDYTGLVAIEYGFHLTLILAGLVLMTGTLRYMRTTGTPAGTATTTTRTKASKAT